MSKDENIMKVASPKYLSRRDKLFVALTINLAIVILEIAGVCFSIYENKWGMFHFYTVDSNITTMLTSLLFCIYAIRAISKQDDVSSGIFPLWLKIAKYISTCLVTVTFLVVVFILAPGAVGHTFFDVTVDTIWYSWYILLFTKSMLYMHFLGPVLAIVSLICFESDMCLEIKHTLWALIPTLFYGILFLILNITKAFKGPYFFLEVYENGAFMSIVWFVVVISFAYLIAFALKVCFNLVYKKSRKE